MDEIPRRRTLTFVVRVWVEYLEQAPPSWRGEIEQVGGEGKVHFQCLQEITAFIENRSEQYASLSRGKNLEVGEGEDLIP
jgi:hypothetical protein